MNKLRNKVIAIGAAIATLLSLTACGSSSSSSGEGVEGGTVHIALNATVTSLDPMITGAYVARDTMRNIYESLVTLKADGSVAPLLAKSYEVSSDNKTFTFKLRTGVKFHNGATMKAEDVVASMQRWIKLSQIGSTFFTGSTVTSPDADTVVITSPKALSTGLYLMADTGRIAAIMPKTVIDKATDTGVQEYIGTGPYKYSSWKKDTNIILEKFADYSSPDGKSDGYSGARTPHADKMEFDFVTDGTTRLTGALSGQYEIGYSLADSQYAQAKASSDVKVEKDEMLETLIFNKQEGIFKDNQKLRQAILASLDMSKIAKAGHQNSDLYNTDGGLMPKTSPLRSESSLDKYNNPDTAAAKKLIQESGYDGSTITFLTTKDYPYMYDESMEIQNELNAVGIKTDIQVLDWASVLQKMFEPGSWDMLISSYSYSANPISYSFFQASGAGWNTDPEFKTIADSINAATSESDQKAGYDKLQDWFYDYVPNIIVSKYQQISAVSSKLGGYSSGMQGPVYYNLQLKE
ncbi:ABC transporter substrate-binding protein [Bifidobacterium psychraerophilum]|jgi:peptide/nickel transport system substrate-binding protein|uniref:ABC transporter periplasmic protein n=3 Tax=Bifidobacterium psychraerophilum TaxID=218140 RepID=A0A087CBV4_9BIFI|nr:ABC transporter substrate-binding protein [Bifidobacterium psychraerophilum]KFI80754.1 ABC transporter periplasmic protein [Bifidobacterium psychraerophilum]MCI1659754.1 ABC transporter substrate-binding protein [Bifidobacterium psychraerophilum]MCI1804689.1 ABC transporter substrate-binding protein [Bifidobacterium psychraerophilum]MCI2176885.1 ABC transporter substrate-binding protein [Bifidobacterium psychraerophilum]MCI2182158.1 ABC transporter substrate-binding protein [Bifidobacterium